MPVVERDPYAVLGVGPDADDATIAAAYRALARRFHPDVAGDAATQRMMVINAAFERIRTEERRQGLTAASLGAFAAPVPSPTHDTDSAAGARAAGPPPPTPGRERLRWRPENDGTGGAGPPPGRPSGSVLDFGRHIGWSLGEIARVDPGYLVWLSERREGRPYADEIDAVLTRVGFRPEPPDASDRSRPGRGVFRRD